MQRIHRAHANWKIIRDKIRIIYIFKNSHRGHKPIEQINKRAAGNGFDPNLNLRYKDDCLSKGTLVMDPRSFFVIFILSIASTLNMVWWIVFTVRLGISPDSPNLIVMNMTERVLDIIFFIEIVLTFFIGIPIDESSYAAKQAIDSKRMYNYNMRDIAKKYFTSTLITDLVSLVPAAMFWHQDHGNWYYLKSIRVIHYYKNAQDINLMIRWFMRRYSTDTVYRSVQIKDYIFTWLVLVLYIHTFNCIWMLLGRT